MAARSSPSSPDTKPPLWFWLLPLAVGLLRTVPYVWSLVVPHSQQTRVLPLGYLPKDTLQYLAFIRQVPADGRFFFYNPFTTEEQSGRFLLLFHWLLGEICRVTGASPGLVLELSRIPLTFLFFFLLWRFLRSIHPDRRARSWACVLIAFSGGLEGFVRPFAAGLPPVVRDAFREETWHLLGWSTFGAFFNPLWIAGLTLTLLALAPVLRGRDSRSRAGGLQFAVALLLALAIHPYSAIVILAVWSATLVAEWLIGQRPPGRKHVELGAALLVAVVPYLALTWWQMRDPVYRASSGGILGTQALPVFWYPLTLGSLGVFALRGAREWTARSHPYLVPLLAWLAACALLHTSTVFNGYHFVFHLHLPVSILAASGIVATLEADAARPRRRLQTTLLVALLFPSCLLVTAESVGDVVPWNVVPEDYVKTTRVMAGLPPGNAMAPPGLGNMLPAYTSHRVWLGHWWLTPDAVEKAAEYETMTSDPGQLDRLRSVLAGQDIRYLIVPRDRGERLARELGPAVARRIAVGELDLLILRPVGLVGARTNLNPPVTSP